MDKISFPRYTTQIINLANQNSQGTRPKVVGQMSILVHEYNKQAKEKSFEDWSKWYKRNHPDAILNAKKKVKTMVDDLKSAITKIDDKMIEDWLIDLVIVKTYFGINFQESILKRVSKLLCENYKLANSAEESKGIDGYIGKMPVSVKPTSYKTKSMLNEKINVKIIFYEKGKSGISVDISQLLE